MRKDAELQQTDSHCIKNAIAGRCLEARAVVRMNEEPGRFEPGKARKCGEEEPALFCSEAGILVGAGKMSAHTCESQARGRTDGGV